MALTTISQSSVYNALERNDDMSLNSIRTLQVVLLAPQHHHLRPETQPTVQSLSETR
jgi:hypothetical protein